MSIIYRTTLVPSKLDLLTDWLPTRTWYQVTGGRPALEKAGGFRLDDPEGEVGIEFMPGYRWPAGRAHSACP